MPWRVDGLPHDAGLLLAANHPGHEVAMLKHAVLTSILLFVCPPSFAENTPELIAALRAYRENVPTEPELTGNFLQRLAQRMDYTEKWRASNYEQLSLAIYKASLKALSHEEYSTGILEGFTEVYGDVHAVPPRNWSNGELALILMENIMSGNDEQKSLGRRLLDDVQVLISNFAGQHATDKHILERVFKLAGELPKILPEGEQIKNWKTNRRNLVVRSINSYGRHENKSQSLVTFTNVRELIPTLPQDLQDQALLALGQSRRKVALPYLMEVVRHEENYGLKLGALTGLAHFAEHAEVLELAREVALEMEPTDLQSSELAVKAVSLIIDHYSQMKRKKRPPSPRAMEIARELWQEPDREDLRRWLLFYLGPIDEKPVEEMFVEALKSPDFNMQKVAMEYSTGGKLITESPLIEEEMIKISENAQNEEQREIAQKYLERRRNLRINTGACEEIVARADKPKPD